MAAVIPKDANGSRLCILTELAVSGVCLSKHQLYKNDLTPHFGFLGLVSSFTEVVLALWHTSYCPVHGEGCNCKCSE
jgi:hypothetical protein